MNPSIRWRIIVLQIVTGLVLAFSAGAGFFANNFIHQQIRDQLAPQSITFPASQQQGLYPDLQQYAGQQVLDGNQAHAYAEQFIARHLNTIGKGHPYSYWSGIAQTTTDPAVAAKASATAESLFKGDTLRTILNEAWTFWVIGDIAFYVAIALTLGTIAVLGALVFEVVEARRQTAPIAAPLQPTRVATV